MAATSDEKLHLPLLQLLEQTPEGIRVLGVNFDPALVCLLRETKYFLLLESSSPPERPERPSTVPTGSGTEGGAAPAVTPREPTRLAVPDSAKELFGASDWFRQQISSLDLICAIYNKVQRTILAVEKPLVQQKLDAVEQALNRGLAELNWKSPEIEAYIRDCKAAVDDVDLVLTTIKENVRLTQQALAKWEVNYMFDRKEGKTYTFEELNDDFNQRIQMRHSEIRDAGKEITKFLSSSNRVLKVRRGKTVHMRAAHLSCCCSCCCCRSARVRPAGGRTWTTSRPSLLTASRPPS